MKLTPSTTPGTEPAPDDARDTQEETWIRCAACGERSTVWTWFPGRAWQVALCKACGTHVGWSFHAEELSPFHGLVRARIV